MKRAVVLAAVLTLAVAPAGAKAAPRWYVATDSAATASGYAVDGVTQVLDDLTLSVQRGGAVVADASGHGFVQVSAPLAAGDTLVLTDTTTAVVRTTTYSGLTLTAPSCGGASFTGVRADGATVAVATDAPGVAPLTVTGAGTALSGSFATPLAAGAVVKASTMRVVDPAFTVFDAVSATVGACPVAAPAPVEPPAPVGSPAPAASPAPPAPAPADTLAPAGRTTLRALTAGALYRTLRAGTLTSSVSISEPATIHQTLVSGATTLAARTLSAARAGTFALKLTLSPSARRRLAAARTSRLTLKTTLRDAAGNLRALPSRTLIARR